MSCGYAAPCPGDDLPYVSRKEETARNLAQIRERQVREASGLSARAAAAGRLPHEQAAAEWAEAQAQAQARAQARAQKAEATRRENQAKGLIPGGKFTHEEAIMWPQTGVPGATFPTAREALACAEKVQRTGMTWNSDNRATLDGLVFHGEAEQETYVLKYFVSTRRLAICRA